MSRPVTGCPPRGCAPEDCAPYPAAHGDAHGCAAASICAAADMRAIVATCCANVGTCTLPARTHRPQHLSRPLHLDGTRAMTGKILRACHMRCADEVRCHWLHSCAHRKWRLRTLAHLRLHREMPAARSAARRMRRHRRCRLHAGRTAWLADTWHRRLKHRRRRGWHCARPQMRHRRILPHHRAVLQVLPAKKLWRTHRSRRALQPHVHSCGRCDWSACTEVRVRACAQHVAPRTLVKL